MKAILISIKPRHCTNIAKGIKKIEVRKSNPKLKTPFKCYIYMTKSEDGCYSDWEYPKRQKVIGEYVCDYITTDFLISDTCISVEDLERYSGNKAIYGWHISDLVIYDEPKELYDFIKPCTDPYQYCQGCKHGHINYPSDVETYEDLSGCCFDTVCLNRIRKAPQSWCYVDEVKNG